LFAGQLLPARASNPVPPACDPTGKTGPFVPACPATLLAEAEAIQSPTINLPDLSPDVTETWIYYDYVGFDGHDFVYGPAHLTFDTWAKNVGNYPVDLLVDQPENLGNSTVSQCLSWTTDFVCRQRQPVGGFTWHDAHKHYHFDNFAKYELRRLNADGTPDFTSDGLLASSPKVSFCLEDSFKFRGDAFPVSRYNLCDGVEEGISPGYSDIYPAYLEGQDVPLTGIGDGTYALVVTLNPAGNVFETTLDNNRIILTVRLDGVDTTNPTGAILEKHLG
jgi:hypothetical protein